MKKLISALLIACMALLPFGCSAGPETRYADKYIDLHCHLDGSITPDIARELARIQGITLTEETDKELDTLLTVSEDCTSTKQELRHQLWG